jgi:hypothetical protein
MRPDFSCPHGGADGTRAKAGPAAGPSIAHAQLTLALRKGIREGVAAAVRPSDSVTDAERIEQAGARLRLRSLLDAEHTAAREAMALAQALGESW